MAHLAAAGPGDDAHRRGAHRDGRVRRDAVPGRRGCTGRWTRRGARARRARRTSGSAAGSAPTGAATRSSPPRYPGRPRSSRPSTCSRAGEHGHPDRPRAHRAGRRGAPGEEFSLALESAETAHPELLAELAARSPGEPYRTFLLYLARRLAATRLRHADLAYRSAADFRHDLLLVQQSLAAAGATRQAFGELQELIWQVETFGFHLAGLEIRQHSAVHARALAEVRAGAAQRSRAARCPSRPPKCWPRSAR